VVGKRIRIGLGKHRKREGRFPEKKEEILIMPFYRPERGSPAHKSMGKKEIHTIYIFGGWHSRAMGRLGGKEKESMLADLQKKRNWGNRGSGRKNAGGAILMLVRFWRGVASS